MKHGKAKKESQKIHMNIDETSEHPDRKSDKNCTENTIIKQQLQPYQCHPRQCNSHSHFQTKHGTFFLKRPFENIQNKNAPPPVCGNNAKSFF